MRAEWLTLAVFGLCGLAAGAVWVVPQGGGPESDRTAVDAPVPVRVAAARSMDVPVTLDGVGTVKASRTVTIRPQVDGRLISIDFREGQNVKQGDVLARIDPTTYQAQLDEALGKKAQTEAQLANARRDLDRYTRLTTNTSVSRQKLDTQRALVAQLEAQARLDQAAIDIARARLAYTTITSPLDGRAGIRRVDAGNVVRAENSDGIVVITRLRPISVVLSLPQQRLTSLNRALVRGSVPAEVLDGRNGAVLDRGVVTVVDNRIDPATGTVKVKAEVPNADLKLWPGQFVNLRLRIDTLKNAVVAPVAALRQGPDGVFVYVVRDDRTVSVRQVKVAQQDARHAVIAEGLAVSDRVVTAGFTRLSDGRRVSATKEEDAPPPPSTIPMNASLARDGVGPGRRGGDGGRPGSGAPR